MRLSETESIAAILRDMRLMPDVNGKTIDLVAYRLCELLTAEAKDFMPTVFLKLAGVR
jgi:hypothetical protein